MPRSKFNVDKDTTSRTYNGIAFDSILEMKYYRDVLCPLIENGSVSAVELQKPYILQPKFIHNSQTVRPITYIADFYIRYRDGKEEVIDIKGYPDATACLKRKIFWYIYPNIEYKWIGYSAVDGGWLSYEYIKKQRALRKKEKKHVFT